jgi:hypothetical protein
MFYAKRGMNMIRIFTRRAKSLCLSAIGRKPNSGWSKELYRDGKSNYYDAKADSTNTYNLHKK